MTSEVDESSNLSIISDCSAIVSDVFGKILKGFSIRGSREEESAHHRIKLFELSRDNAEFISDICDIVLGQFGIAACPLVFASFESSRQWRRRSLDALGIDLFSFRSCYLVRLPCLIKDFEATIAAARSQMIDVAETEKAASGIRQFLANGLWRDFEHGCRAAAAGGSEGWRKIKEELIPSMEESLARLETDEVKFFVTEREKIKELFRGDTPQFEELLAALGKAGPLELLASRSSTGFQFVSPPHFLTKILVVEDDVSFGSGLKGELEKAGHSVILITDIKTPIDQIEKRARRNAAEVVLLDLEFGSLQKGFSILRALKEKNKGIKVAVITGHGNQNITDAKRMGADTYFLKPIKIEQLLQKINELLVDRYILVLDDEIGAIVNNDFIQRLSARRCIPIAFGDMDQVLTFIRDDELPGLHRVSLVLLDLRFGQEFRGIEIFKEIKRRRSDLPIFVLTGYGDNETRLRVAFGELRDYFTSKDDYLVKPLREEGWMKIFAALFPTPIRIELCLATLSISLFGAVGISLGSVTLPPKHWALLCYLALKREKGEGMAISKGSREYGGIDWEDPIMARVHRLLDDKFHIWSRRSVELGYDWSEPEVRGSVTRIGKAVERVLGYQYEIVSRSEKGVYALSPTIKEISIITE